MKRYEKYKDSGVDWIGEIPEHWECKRLGTWFTERREKVSDKDYAPLSVTKNGIVPQLDNAAKSNDGDNRKLVKEGDFVINSRSDRKGSSGLSLLDGSVSLINIVMKPRNIDGKFSQYLLKSRAFVEEFYRNGHGIVADLWTTRFDEMKFINISVPPIKEQKNIATFLDDKTSKIDQTIAIKEKEIELLKERRQILIQKAVTKGLDDTVKLKDSGVDWIGEIPEHWEVRKLKYLANVVLGKMICNEDKGNYKLKPYLKSKNIQWMYLNLDSVDEMWFSERELNQYKLQKGDIVVSEGGEVGKATLWNDELPECYIQNSAHKVTFTSNNNNKYYLMCFFNYGKIGVFDSVVNKVSIGHLTREKLVNIYFPNPTREEQNEIISYLEEIKANIAKAITLKKQEIEKLKEYKAVLIDNVVTGKVRVK